ncbi:MAG: efflux RND transporter permease subunit [Alphaproteobacteria bacterium]
MAESVMARPPSAPIGREPERGDIASLSIRRPVLTVVASLLIVIAGLAALLGVEVRELPDVDRPVVTVRATYQGAAPETMDAEVTRPIEGAVARVAGVTSISATSEESSTRIVVEFDPSVDLAEAANDLREAVARVQRQLPTEVEDVLVIKADDGARPVLRLAVTSVRHTEDELTRIVEDLIVPELAGVPGVADVPVYGSRQRVLRVAVDPIRLASYGLAFDDVARTLRNAPFDVPVGTLDPEEQSLIVRADASVFDTVQAERLVIRGDTRIGDVADVSFGPAKATSYTRFNGVGVLGLGIVRQAQSNTIAISSGVDRAIERLNASLDGVQITKNFDEAVFIRGAIREVVTSLAIAVVIVVSVIYLFLGSLRATLIPAAAIPVALIGTLAAIWMLGFSVNILTLLALVLATGLVVDDSIVVLENVQRKRSAGLGPRAAAVLGTRQVFFAVIATTATLAAVFVPISFLPGNAGRLFGEFGFVLAFAVTISSFVALTLSPMLASRLGAGDTPPGGLRAGLGRAGTRMASAYRVLLDHALRMRIVVLGICLLAAGVAAALYAQLDEELLPTEDRGVMLISLTGPDGVSLAYTDRQVAQVEALFQPHVESGEVTGVYAIVGRGDPNRAFVIARLADWGERIRRQDQITADLRGPLSAIPGARINVLSPNSLGIRGLGVPLEFAVAGTDYARIADVAAEMVSRLRDGAPEVSNPRMGYSTTQPQLSVVLDRDRAADLSLDIEGVSAALRAMASGYEVARLNVDDRAVPIMLHASTGMIDDPEDLRSLFIATGNGRLVPLSAIATLEETGISPQLGREQQRRAIGIDADLGAGHTLGEAMAAVRRIADEVVPGDMQVVFLNQAAALDETSSGIAITFAIAILVVLLVLAAQFESFASAVVVVVTVPFGVAAAVAALWLTGMTLNIYSQIGLVLLVGLMAKNGILIVEFANQLRDQGQTVAEAARNAALIRLRPVMMTMISTVLGGLPLVIGSGPGAEARAAIGWVAFGGLGFATVFTLFLTPVAYTLLAGFSPARGDEERRLAEELRAARDIDIPDEADMAAAEPAR